MPPLLEDQAAADKADVERAAEKTDVERAAEKADVERATAAAGTQDEDEERAADE